VDLGLRLADHRAVAHTRDHVKPCTTVQFAEQRQHLPLREHRERRRVRDGVDRPDPQRVAVGALHVAEIVVVRDRHVSAAVRLLPLRLLRGEHQPCSWRIIASARSRLISARS
jgi:hypothetical protein